MTTVRLPERRKYRNVPTVVDGIRFASKREAARYQELKLMQMAQEISGLIADKSALRWDLRVNGLLICRYEADFRYCEKLGGCNVGWITEDVKGFKTPAYRMKKKLMKAIWGIEIREV